MIVERCRDQRGSIDQFYEKIAAESDNGDGATAMLALIAKLRASAPEDRRVFCLTSLHRLCLLSSDSGGSEWWVIVSALDEANFFIEYLMPENAAPWPGAYVRGEAESVEVALSMILIAMHNSGGWH